MLGLILRDKNPSLAPPTPLYFKINANPPRLGGLRLPLLYFKINLNASPKGVASEIKKATIFIFIKIKKGDLGFLYKNSRLEGLGAFLFYLFL